MPSENIRFQGTVESAKGNGFFSVGIFFEETGVNKSLLCRLSGKMRTHNIKIVTGDKVTIEIDPHDMTKGLIVYRERGQNRGPRKRK